MGEKEFVAYRGERFTIEWYHNEAGDSQPLKYYEALDKIGRQRLFSLFVKMGTFGKIYNKTKFNYEGDGIFAFKPQPHRFMSFFMKEKKIIVTNAFWKKQDKMPRTEKDRAIDCKNNYFKRTKEGTYYK